MAESGRFESEVAIKNLFLFTAMLHLTPTLALVLLVGSAAADDGYCPMSPQCRPGHEECGPLYGNSSSQFHVRDTSCSNGTLYSWGTSANKEALLAWPTTETSHRHTAVFHMSSFHRTANPRLLTPLGSSTNPSYLYTHSLYLSRAGDPNGMFFDPTHQLYHIFYQVRGEQ